MSKAAWSQIKMLLTWAACGLLVLCVYEIFFAPWHPAQQWCKDRGYTYVETRDLVICVDKDGHPLVPPNNP